MFAPILATKLYIPPPRPKAVLRPRLIERLNEGLRQSGGFARKLTLVSAPAGFGKTTLISEWIADCSSPAAWLSLDEGDNDPARFLTYLITALKAIKANIATGVLGVLQAPQPPPIEAILTTLLNEITTIPEHFILVLDDYHVIDTKTVDAATSVDHALSFLLERLPPQMHLVIATRADPQLSLSRLRARGQLTELRAADLRFTPSEAAEFLKQVMGLNLSTDDIEALETRTEGWIAGLQLAALSVQGLYLQQGTTSMQRHPDVSSFIQSFTGSHRFIMDYLVEEVLHQQPESIQTFLLYTSILDRLCGPLCDAVCSVGKASSSFGTAVLLGGGDQHLAPSAYGQETLAYLEHANLFVIPLDNERRWYRYHHLFADLLRQRLLQQSHQSIASSTADAESRVKELHIRASQWYEDNGLDIEAFHHAAAANDIDRAERLMDGKGIPLHLRGAVTAILDWLGSLPRAVMDARPSLWWRYGAMMLVVGQTIGVEEKLDAAEAAVAAKAALAARALHSTEADDPTRYLIGRIAAARAVLALTRYQVETMITQSRRALEYLPPTNLTVRANANWTLGTAYFFAGERAAARQSLIEAIALSQKAGDTFTTILATIGLGNVQEVENQLHQAAELYRRILQLAGDQPLQIIYEAHLGLARVLYEWNELDAAEKHGRQSLHLARQYDRVIDRFIVCEVFLARVKQAQGDVAGAAAILAQADQAAHQQNFVYRIPEVAAAQVVVLLGQGNLAAAAHLAQTYELPISQARVLLAQGDTSAALAVLEPLRQHMEAKNWQDERLKVMVLQAVALHSHGEKDKAMQLLGDALALAEPGGFIRLFVDEGLPMLRLLSEAVAQGIMPDYVGKLLAVFETEKQKNVDKSHLPTAQPLIEPLSQRELEVLQLIAKGLSNEEISERLFLALSTIKGHNRNIYSKLQVQRRTEAVARARELGLV